MPQSQLNALIAVSHQLPEIAKQLKIANKLKAWELKLKYRELTPPFDHAAEIDKIMKDGQLSG